MDWKNLFLTAINSNMSVKTRVLYIGRMLGLYKGPIHFVVKAPVLHFGVTGKPPHVHNVQ